MSIKSCHVAHFFKMSFDIGYCRNLQLSLKKNLGLYHITLKGSSKFFWLTLVELQAFPDLTNLDTDSQISEFCWKLDNGKRKVEISFRNDTQEIKLSYYRLIDSLWNLKRFFELHYSEYQKLLENRQVLLCYANTFKKTCIDIDETPQS